MGKGTQVLKVVKGVIIGFVVLLVAILITILIKPNFAKSLAEKIFSGTASASKEPEVLSRYPVKGASVDNTILVKFKSSTNNTQISQILTKTKTKQKKEIDGIKTRVITIPTNASVGQTISKFKAMKEVEYAEPNYIATALLTPNDPQYSTQWGLTKMQTSSAWDLAKGNFGPIAVVDTGVLSTHPDLSGEVSNGYNFVSNNTNATDDHGHGTHVSGIIGAITNNSTGVASIGYKSSIIPVKVLNSAGSGTYDAVASGITYAADRGAKVINLSLGGASPSVTLQNAVNYANNKGVYVVAAAGNSASSAPLYPAACTGAIAISATDSADNLATFSSYGKNVFSGAPGVSINSTYLSNSYRYMSGTSMATPQFSGLLELALGYASSTNQTVGKADMLNYIKSTSDKVGSFPYDANGWNQYFGYGRINASKLITLLSNKVPQPSPTPSKTASVTATPSPSPTATATATQVVPTPEKFNVVIGGTIDNINSNKTVIQVRLTNISQNLKLSPKNIVDLVVNKSTQIKRGNKKLSVSDLKVNDKLNVKALYSGNVLTALSITVQGK